MTNLMSCAGSTFRIFCCHDQAAFLWEANFQGEFPESSKGRVSFSLKSSEVSEDTSTFHIGYIDTLRTWWCFFVIYNPYMLVGFPAGKRLDFTQPRQVDRWHRG